MKTIAISLKAIMLSACLFLVINSSNAQKSSLDPYTPGMENNDQLESLEIAFLSFRMSTTGDWVFVVYDGTTSDYHSFDGYGFDIRWYSDTGKEIARGIACTVKPDRRISVRVTNLRNGKTGCGFARSPNSKI